MRQLMAGGAALAFVTSILLMRIVLHGYTDHNHVDVFHLIVALVSAMIGVVLLLRVLRSRAA